MKELNQKAAFPSQAGRQDVALLDYMHVGMGSAFLKVRTPWGPCPWMGGCRLLVRISDTPLGMDGGG